MGRYLRKPSLLFGATTVRGVFNRQSYCLVLISHPVSTVLGEGRKQMALRGIQEPKSLNSEAPGSLLVACVIAVGHRDTSEAH